MIRSLFASFFFCLLLLAPSALTRAAEPTAADLLPASTALYAEISQPGKLVDLAMDHPIHQRVRGMNEYQQALQAPQYQQFLLGVKVLEGALEMRWRPGLKLLTGGGVYVAGDPSTQGVALLIKSGDAEKLAALREAVFTMVRASRQNGGEDPIKPADYRGITAYGIGQAGVAVFGNWIVATNKHEFGKAILDRYLDGENAGGNSLSKNAQFQEAQKTRPAQALAWAYADVKSLREAGAASKVFDGPKDNPVAELLLGGIIAMAKEAPYATLSLEADQQHLSLAAAMPFNPQAVEAPRLYYFGPEGKGEAPPLANVKETVFSLSTYRDLPEFWASAPDLFDDNIQAKFAAADSTLTTLFSGRDFGDEILGSGQPEMQLVVARQTLPQADLPAPNIKLPAFAVVFRLKDEANVRRNLKVSYQSLLGFLNVTGAMNGQPPLEQNTEEINGATIVSGTYIPPATPPEGGGPINYNFSPTVAFAGDKYIVSSTRALAVELAELAQKPETPSTEAVKVNTEARLDPSVLRMILNDNREQLIAQNMLEKGHSREEAEKEIGGLFELLTWVSGSSLRLSHDESTLQLQWSVGFTPHENQVKN